MKKLALFAFTLLSAWAMTAKTITGPVDYVSPLVGTQSKHALSTGNTYPAIALPWGMNFWVPQTGKMGDGWAYTYDADKIRGFKQTHQPSPWINDYGQFAIMPVTGKAVFNQDERASWFSHKAETATPYYYKVYLADHDVVTEIAPTERAAAFRFTFPENDHSYVVVDAFDKGSFVYMFTDTGFWDTFRCLFPFLNLMYPSMNTKMQEGLVNTYKESGFLPEWASPGHRGCMVGNNSASVVADAYLKGLKGYDIETLWEAVKHGANAVHPNVRSTGRLGHEYYNKLGYVPYNVGINENAARTLEYAYDDWCI